MSKLKALKNTQPNFPAVVTEEPEMNVSQTGCTKLKKKKNTSEVGLMWGEEHNFLFAMALWLYKTICLSEKEKLNCNLKMV